MHSGSESIISNKCIVWFLEYIHIYSDFYSEQ